MRPVAFNGLAKHSRRFAVASNDDKQSGDRGSGSNERGFAAMDEEKRRKIAEKGGEVSAREQKRDEEGQFAGKDRSSNSGESRR
jgi:general stress protein YciG